MTTELTGRELDEAVAIKCGWERIDGGEMDMWRRRTESGLSVRTGPPPTDIVLALALLLELDDIRIQFIDGHIFVLQILAAGQSLLLASGPKSEAAAVCCRAWLKMKEQQNGQA